MKIYHIVTVFGSLFYKKKANQAIFSFFFFLIHDIPFGMLLLYNQLSEPSLNEEIGGKTP